MPQRNSEIPERKGEEARKIHGRRGWQGERAHPPEVAARIPSPEAAPIHGGSALHRLGPRGLLGGSPSGSSRPRSSPSAGRLARKIHPDWSPSPSPLPSPSSPAPEPPSSPSPSSPARHVRSGSAGARASATKKPKEEKREWEHTVQETPVRRLI